MKKIQRNIILLLGVVICGGIALWLYSTSDAARIRSNFGIHLPQKSTVVARNIKILGMDWSVAWAINLKNKIKPFELVPEGFDKLPEAPDASSKYQEVLEHFRRELPGSLTGFGDTLVFIGGPQGNSFIGISEDLEQIILFRFRT